MVELTDFLQAATLRGGFFYPLMGSCNMRCASRADPFISERMGISSYEIEKTIYSIYTIHLIFV